MSAAQYGILPSAMMLVVEDGTYWSENRVYLHSRAPWYWTLRSPERWLQISPLFLTSGIYHRSGCLPPGILGHLKPHTSQYLGLEGWGGAA